MIILNKKKVFLVFAIIISILLLSSTISITARGLSYNDRPFEIQERVDESFNQLSREEKSAWPINGPENRIVIDGKPQLVHKYGMCGVDDEKLVMDIISSAPATQKEFYFIDVGAGEFQWVDNIHKFLKQSPQMLDNKIYHIIGLNGEGKDKISKENNFVIYKLGGFKIENIQEAFLARGMDLDGKVDLIVSQWTLRHLVDPLGTFLQIFRLTKLNGYMLLEGIPFYRLDKNGNDIYEDSITGRNLNAEHLLRDMKQSYLMCPTNSGGVDGAYRDIIIHKQGLELDYDIGLTYYGVQGYVSQFKSKNSDKLLTTVDDTVKYDKYNGDKSLYDRLIKQDLFIHQVNLGLFVADFILSDTPACLEKKEL